MNPNDRVELEELRAQQRLLRRELEAMEARLERILSPAEAPEPQLQPPPIAVVKAAPLLPAEPPPLPKIAPPSPALPAVSQPIPIPPPVHSRFDPAPESFEQKFGAFWLVRIGVVILLTGFVFLGNYAYQHVIHQLGPLGKVMLLIAAGGALAGAGLWLERGAEKMRNFARVLIAGGLAAIYYTTYAAHFVENLRVIASPLVGGGALLALAGGIAWFADRRKSETIALLVVLLSYYTAAINPVAGFSLFSNLLLTALAVFFLARHRWTNISYASLVATYASFGYARFLQTGSLLIPAQLSSADLLAQSGYLLSYWTLFTVAVFLSRAEAFTPRQRTPFLTANNAAFFGLVAPTIGVIEPGAFSAFAFGFGAMLLTLSLLARRIRADDLLMDGAYLAQGLALVTVGIATHFTGYQLALALAIESTVLLEMSRFRHGLLYQIGAALVALGAFAAAVAAIFADRGQTIPLGTTLTLLFLANAWRFKQSRGELAAPRWRWFPAGFVALAFLTVPAVLHQWLGDRHFVAALALTSVACAASLHLLRLPEVSLLGQGFLLLANLLWQVHADFQVSRDAHVPFLIGAALAHLHWWPRQRVWQFGESARSFAGLPYALSAVGILHVWLPPKFSEPAWMAVSGAVAISILAYGLATRAGWLALLSQTFMVVSAFGFFAHFLNSGRAWPLPFEWLPIVPPALLAVQTAAGTMLTSRLPLALRSPVALLAKSWRIVLTAMLFTWCLACLPRPMQASGILLLATTYFAVGAFAKRGGAMLHAAALAMGALALIWGRSLLDGEVFAADLGGVLLLLAVQTFARRRQLRAPLFPAVAHPVVALSALATLWLQVTHFAQRSAHGLLITISWSLLAFVVLAAGFLLRERIFRQSALAVFALAIGRVFLIDVWKFETIYRIASFLLLGLLLIVVSFAYNRFGDRLRSMW